VTAIETLQGQFEFNRGRTLGLLDKIEQQSDPLAMLGWRPGAGRAHMAWQLTHIGIAEQLFASERLATKEGHHRELWDRFKGGSTPDDDVPTPKLIRDVLAAGREDLLATLSNYDETQLDDIAWEAPDGRRLKLLDVLRIISWHEAHHQGQAHITFNLWKAGQ
jgi:uncharacterized damage-inducible protein DinB